MCMYIYIYTYTHMHIHNICIYVCCLLSCWTRGRFRGRPKEKSGGNTFDQNTLFVFVCFGVCIEERQRERERDVCISVYIHTCSTCIYMPTPIHMHMQETKEAFTKARETLLHRATLQNSTIAYTAGFLVSFDCGYAQHQHTGTCSILNRKIVHWN